MAKGRLGVHKNGVSHKKGSFRPGYGFVRCDLAPAQFEGETLVSIVRLDGGSAVAIVGKGDTRPHGPVNQPTVGDVIVTVIERIDKGFLVELPAEAINSTSRVRVPEARVHFS